MLEALQGVPGYENFQMANNAVRGTDNERKFAYLVDGDTKLYTAEQIADILATNKATEETEDKDYAAEATEILQKLTEALGGDQKTADTLVGAIASKDYSSLTADQINTIKVASDSGALKGVIDSDD